MAEPPETGDAASELATNDCASLGTALETALGCNDVRKGLGDSPVIRPRGNVPIAVSIAAPLDERKGFCDEPKFFGDVELVSFGAGAVCCVAGGGFNGPVSVTGPCRGSLGGGGTGGGITNDCESPLEVEGALTLSPLGSCALECENWSPVGGTKGASDGGQAAAGFSELRLPVGLACVSPPCRELAVATREPSLGPADCEFGLSAREHPNITKEQMAAATTRFFIGRLDRGAN